MKFILNSKIIETSESPGKHTLDFIRKLGLTGPKEGCHEGDCGACMVLVGELCGDEVKYKAMNSCILPLGKIEGKHVVTIEGINIEGLNPVQQALCDEGGVQCGYCTPGFVMSAVKLLEEKPTPSQLEIKHAISGNLCRCTGYYKIITAIEKAAKK